MAIYRFVERKYNSMITATSSSGFGYETLIDFKTYDEAKKYLEGTEYSLNRVFKNLRKLIDEKDRKAYVRYNVELDSIEYIDVFIIELALV